MNCHKSLTVILGIAINTLIVISLLAFPYRITRVIIKIWAGIAIAGGGLGLLVNLFYLVSRGIEKIQVGSLIGFLLVFIIGAVVFNFWDKSTSPVKEKT
jgi:uncharacterized membrane protein